MTDRAPSAPLLHTLGIIHRVKVKLLGFIIVAGVCLLCRLIGAIL